MTCFQILFRVLAVATFSVVSTLVPYLSPAFAGSRPVIIGPPIVFVPNDMVIRVQSDEGGGRNEQGNEGGGAGPGAPPPLTTGSGISSALQDLTTLCRNLGDSSYAISCLAAAYEAIANRIPQYGDMAVTRAVLLDTSKKLRMLVSENWDATKPPLRVSTRGNKPLKLNRSLRAVREQSLPKVARQAEVIINNGATVLLRATGDSDRIRAQYQQVARSMQTGAIMLRSL
jgi:hypothetical protein